ncbi:flagellar hook-length control protein FliK [Marichromatium bheemlicum]|uniref:Flagellar hook-length control protein FliK n=1 Tax=Marichromatium bheemlicum TaxID=365339 RepID=A0ABX1IAR6_9GAMM|nr:flagellar hook-length control protein FliK [Marichromatium bheemlicum]NKN33186.1 flagellar hook-length control protein FliK [Marichromatium bheemlicum]
MRQPLELTLGLRLELKLESTTARSTTTTETIARIRPAGGDSVWSAPVRLQLLMPGNSRPQGSAPAAAGTAPPTPTTPVTAEVIALRPIPTLRLLPATGTPTPGGGVVMTHDWVVQQLRTHLPQAQALAEGLGHWVQRLSSPTPASPKGLAPDSGAATDPLMARLTRLLNRLPDSATLTDPGRLQQRVEGSGIWLEARLAQLAHTPGATTTLADDLKGQLLQIAEQLRRHHQDQVTADAAQRSLLSSAASKALEKEAEGMLKQLISLQLQPLEQPAEQPRWVLELPYREGGGVNTVQAEIERERRPEDAEEAGWTIRLRLDLPELGPLAIRLTFKEQQLRASLVAEQATTAALLRHQLPLLRHQLEARELEIASLHAGQGRTPDPARPVGPLFSEQA